MSQAYVLATVEPGQVKNAVGAIKALQSVEDAHAVTGPYDIIAKVNATTADEVGRAVIADIQNVPGVERTLTCLVVEI